MGEAKRRAALGLPSSPEIAIAVATTWWDNAPIVNSATALMTTDLRTIKEIGEHVADDPVDVIVAALRESFVNNYQMTKPDETATIIAAYVSKTLSLQRMIENKFDGMWIKLLIKGDDALARPSLIAARAMITEKMESYRTGTMTPSDVGALILSTHPDDVSFTGGPDMLARVRLHAVTEKSDRPPTATPSYDGIAGGWGLGKSRFVGRSRLH